MEDEEEVVVVVQEVVKTVVEVVRGVAQERERRLTSPEELSTPSGVASSK